MRLSLSLLSSMLLPRRNTLFISTSTDAASLNIYNHLVNNFQWAIISQSSSDKKIHKSLTEEGKYNHVYMWLIHEPTIHLNYPDQRFLENFRQHLDSDDVPAIDDILFLSRHAAASGTVSLTVHPIGIPWQDDAVRSGGIPGRCTPPSSHIATLYRLISTATKLKGLDKAFQTSLEATHHGPFADIPCCFVEIGSSESEWSNEEAGEIWSLCLAQYFHLQPSSSNSVDLSILESLKTVQEENVAKEQRIAVVLIGGGHYTPRMSDLIKVGDNVFAGHALATYALEEHLKTPETMRWKQIITEAVQATRITFPTEKLVCMVDKRAFVEAHRSMIGKALDELGMPWTFKTSDVKRWAEELYCSKSRSNSKEKIEVGSG